MSLSINLYREFTASPATCTSEIQHQLPNGQIITTREEMTSAISGCVIVDGTYLDITQVSYIFDVIRKDLQDIARKQSRENLEVLGSKEPLYCYLTTGNINRLYEHVFPKDKSFIELTINLEIDTEPGIATVIANNVAIFIAEILSSFFKAYSNSQ